MDDAADTFHFLGILEVLTRHRADFILVGGVAAILHGVPVSTFDLDIVISDDEANYPPLLAAFQELGAKYRDPAGREFFPDTSRLATFKIHRLSTRFGPLDVMKSIGHGLTYAALVEHTQQFDVAVSVRVLDLDKIIESKEQANRDKDRQTLPLLRRTLELANTP